MIICIEPMVTFTTWVKTWVHSTMHLVHPNLRYVTTICVHASVKNIVHKCSTPSINTRNVATLDVPFWGA